MARIQSFEELPRANRSRQTSVHCGWQVVDVGGETLLQLDTYGSSTRDLVGKVSQTIQLDRAGATELAAILRRVFPGI